MKLRNKKTGEIVDFVTGIYADSEDRTYEFSSIADLNEYMEDVPEEPKEAWAISMFEELYEISNLSLTRIEKLKEIGNYFSSEKEAEKAVEKLKAWKRLRDKGFRFDNVNGCWIEFTLKSATSDEDYEQGQEDLHLLFGGEE